MGLLETVKKTEVKARFGGISEESYLTIGLTAMQLDNIGHQYGPVCVQSGNEPPIQVKVYNAFGMRGIGGCGIRVSSMLADDLGLKFGDKVTLYTESWPSFFKRIFCKNDETY